MEFKLKESLVLQKNGEGTGKGSKSGTLQKDTDKEGRGKLEGSQKTIKLLILIAITFDFMSYTYENIKDCLGSPSEVPLFSSL